MHLVIIGGSDTGISAALRARELDREIDITVLVGDAYPNFSICGVPFYLSGEIERWQALAHRTQNDIESLGIELRLNTRATAIHAAEHALSLQNRESQESRIRYDRLIVATGARPIRPPLPGVDSPRVFFLHSMEDSFRLETFLTSAKPRSAVIIGAGYIGVEMADALTRRQIQVTLVEQAATVLPTVHEELGEMLQDHMHSHGVRVRTRARVTALEDGEDGIFVHGEPDWHVETDLVLVAVGVSPDTALARAAGIAAGIRGAIRVDRYMRTSLPDVWAAGDCVETYHRLLGSNTYLPLGTTAHKQGRIAGENAVGGRRAFEGSLGTQVVKVFDWAIGRTGLTEAEARHAGFYPLKASVTDWDHKVYYPGATPMTVALIGDRSTGRLLGGQIVGHWQGQVAKRLDILATTLHHQATVESLNDLDLSYTPPLRSPWDPVQQAAQKWLKVLS
ncbi:MAG: FAD-dependent oxidoreductase [Firmicutes bacterium]|nr:FAD-dependent oxidoreductase [Bacillota bacterium]